MVKCAVIGCGVIAPTHVEGYQALPDAKVVHLCDLKLDKAKKLAAKYGVERVSRDYRKVLADPEVDLVSICTDHASHAKLVCAALEAGKHVVCEKSAGRVQSDLDKMVAAAAAHPELVASGIFQHRFEPHNIAFRKLVNEGKMGKLLTLNMNFSCFRSADYYRSGSWRGTQKGEGGGVLINQAIHHLDQLRFVFGEVVAVTAKTANLTHQGVIDVEDTAAFLLEFESGLFGSCTISNSSPSTWHVALTLTGDQIFLEYDDEVATCVKGWDAKCEKLVRDALSGEKNAASVSGKSYYGAGHTGQLADVVAAVKKHRAPKVTLADAATTSSLVMAIYRSAKTGRRVEVKRYC